MEVEEAEGGVEGGKSQTLDGAGARKALVVCPHDNTVWAVSRMVRTPCMRQLAVDTCIDCVC